MNTETDATPPKECHADCGKTTDEHSLSEHDTMGPGWVEVDRRIYCSVACHDKPPIAAPQHSAAMAKLEVKTTVAGKCPLCGVAVPSTHIHLCSPRHAERRKGQRWEFRSTSGAVASGISDIVDGVFMILAPGGQPYMYGPDDPDVGSKWHMLADAPAEPGCPSGCVVCPIHAPPAHEAPKLLKAVVKAMDAHYRRPGYEAPKAAPVCCGRCGGSIGIRNVPFEQGLIKMCHGCRDNLAAWMWAQTGTPYKGPERLRNVLARDEQIESDWLPEESR